MSAALTTLGQSSGGQIQVPSSVVAGGGGTSSGGQVKVEGSAGQPFSGPLQGGTLSVAGGVWPTSLGSAPAAGPVTVSGTVTVAPNATLAGVTVTLGGGVTRETITDATGAYRFDNVDPNLPYTVTPSRVNFSFAPASRSFTFLAGNTDASFVATPNGGHQNPLDTPEFFVRQQYVDFLGREPDTSGFNFWTNQMTSCGADSQCVEIRRINVSAAFFLSIEFQQTGYLVERMYKAAYGDAEGTSAFDGTHTLAVPAVRFGEFLADTREIGKGVVVLQPGWEQALENNKQAFASEFVQRPRFASAFPTTLSPAEFVDRLNQNAGGVLSPADRAGVVALFGPSTDTSNTAARAQALRQVAENQSLSSAEFDRAFVLMQYFGYLRRNPDDAPDADFTGYDFWLRKLNQFGGNFINAEMVKAFISSNEYRQRLAQ